MRGVLVAVDLETTGLDPRVDRIIEIAALKFENERIVGEWQSLVNPLRPIPFHISQLTGIRDEDVRTAPEIGALIPQLRQFIGTAPVVGHNIAFDVDFLREARLALRNPLIDTYVLSAVLLPRAARYSLASLAVEFGLSIDGAHRALNDVYTTHHVLLRLWEAAKKLPASIVREIITHGHNLQWGGESFFSALASEMGSSSIKYSDEAVANNAILASADMLSPSPDMPGETIDINPTREWLAGILEPGGLISQVDSRFEYRPQQVEMLRAVYDALSKNHHTLIEAPTGVGKSRAYLIPSIFFALENNERVVISTNTINLQDQLIHKDLPFLRSALPIPFQFAVLKGRKNYLCPRRLAALRRRGPSSSVEMLVLAKILVWKTDNVVGDRSELTLRGTVEEAVWSRLSAEDEGCTLNRCLTQEAGDCPFFMAHSAAEHAHLLIVNHALLLSDVSTEGRILPPYDYLIVDEAHHLEDAITTSLSFRTDASAIIRQLAQLGTSSSGMLGELLRNSHGIIPPSYYDTLEEYIQLIVHVASRMNEHVNWYFESFQLFIEQNVNRVRNNYVQQIRVTPALRSHSGWALIMAHWNNLGNFTSGISEAMQKLASGLGDLRDYGVPEFEDIVAGVRSASRHLDDLHRNLHEITTEPDPNKIYWVEFQPDGSRMSIHSAPLDVGPLVSRHVWDQKQAVVMTSATLRIDDSFAYIRDRLDAVNIHEVTIETPFDYANSTLLFIANDIPEPAENHPYQRAVEAAITGLAKALKGRTMVLFTSYAQLKLTANSIEEPLAKSGIVLYDQTDGISRNQLLEGFVRSESAVLMGTRSFWEGVDVPGEDLSALVIVRLPFNVPSDPLFAARSEQFTNAFYEYSIPDTILRFRQGFGRLIRRKDDKGVVAILDRRIISKAYGQMFLNSLPECTVRRAPLADLPAEASRWLRITS